MRTMLSLCAIMLGLLLISSAGTALAQLFVTPACTGNIYGGFCPMLGDERLSIFVHDLALWVARVRLSLPKGFIVSIAFYLGLIMGGLALGLAGSWGLHRMVKNKRSGTFSN